MERLQSLTARLSAAVSPADVAQIIVDESRDVLGARAALGERAGRRRARSCVWSRRTDTARTSSRSTGGSRRVPGLAVSEAAGSGSRRGSSRRRRWRRSLPGVRRGRAGDGRRGARRASARWRPSAPFGFLALRFDGPRDVHRRPEGADRVVRRPVQPVARARAAVRARSAARSAAEQHRGELQFLSEVSQTLAGTLEMDELLDTLLSLDGPAPRRRGQLLPARGRPPPAPRRLGERRPGEDGADARASRRQDRSRRRARTARSPASVRTREPVAIPRLDSRLLDALALRRVPAPHARVARDARLARAAARRARRVDRRAHARDHRRPRLHGSRPRSRPRVREPRRARAHERVRLRARAVGARVRRGRVRAARPSAPDHRRARPGSDDGRGGAGDRRRGRSRLRRRRGGRRSCSRRTARDSARRRRRAISTELLGRYGPLSTDQEVPAVGGDPLERACSGSSRPRSSPPAIPTTRRCGTGSSAVGFVPLVGRREAARPPDGELRSAAARPEPGRQGADRRARCSSAARRSSGRGSTSGSRTRAAGPRRRACGSTTCRRSSRRACRRSPSTTSCASFSPTSKRILHADRAVILTLNEEDGALYIRAAQGVGSGDRARPSACRSDAASPVGSPPRASRGSSPTSPTVDVVSDVPARRGRLADRGAAHRSRAACSA